MRTISNVLQAAMDRGAMTVRIISTSETEGHFKLVEVMQDAAIVHGPDKRQFVLPYAGMRLLEIV